MKRDKETYEQTRDAAYHALERFLFDSAIVRCVDNIGNGHWIISKAEAEKIHDVLGILADCGCEGEF